MFAKIIKIFTKYKTKKQAVTTTCYDIYRLGRLGGLEVRSMRRP